MKTVIIAFLTTVLMSTLAQACPGGNLLQVMTEDDGVVVATYNIYSGELLAQNELFRIISINIYDQANEELGKSVCVGENGACTKLSDIENKDIIVKHQTYSQGHLLTGYRVIENANVGPHVVTTRGMAKGMLDLLTPIGCAKK